MKIAVIGSGIGGIAVALRLAAKGHDVTVFEKNAKPGGKIGEMHIDGYRFDTGPSLVTLPKLIDELYDLAGKAFQKSIAFQKLDVLCKYFYNSGEQLIAYSDQNKFKEECRIVFDENPEYIKVLVFTGVSKLTSIPFLIVK